MYRSIELRTAFGASSFALACAAVSACSGGTGRTKMDAPDVDFDRNALLANLASNILLPMQAEVDAKAALLPASLGAYCDALDGGNSGTIASTRDAFSTAFATAMDAWQRADALLVGPAEMDNRALRDRIYAWPALAPCDLDRDVITYWTTPSSYDLSTRTGRVRSLGAVEYLFFRTDPMHNCAVEPAGWVALGADLPRARCRLAHVIATDVAVAAAELHTAWGSYADELSRAGQGSSLPSAHEAVNMVSNSFFFVDRIVKDMKIGEAAGIVATNACGVMNTPCLREVELQYSDRASFAIRANLRALTEALTGDRPQRDEHPASQGPGFDDFLIAIGHGELAASMIDDLVAANANVDQLPDSFLGALASNYQAVVDSHAAVKLFTNDLKSQFLTVLSLDIPDDVASDND
jgi:uncharacterized protein